MQHVGCTRGVKKQSHSGLCLSSRGSLIDQCSEPRRPKVECSSTQRIGGMLQPHPISNGIDAASLFLCLFLNKFDLVLTGVSFKFVCWDDSRQRALNSTTFVRQWSGRMLQDTVPPPPLPPYNGVRAYRAGGIAWPPPVAMPKPCPEQNLAGIPLLQCNIVIIKRLRGCEVCCFERFARDVVQKRASQGNSSPRRLARPCCVKITSQYGTFA